MVQSEDARAIKLNIKEHHAVAATNESTSFKIMSISHCKKQSLIMSYITKGKAL